MARLSRRTSGASGIRWVCRRSAVTWSSSNLGQRAWPHHLHFGQEEFFVLLEGSGTLENVAAHLTDDGAFVVEAYVPSFLYRLRNDQYVEAEAVEVDEVRLDVLRHDAAAQTIEESHVSLSEAGVRLTPVVQRYAWPSELDLMARIAGLRLKQRWGGWERQVFDSRSETHVSVYGR